MANIIHHTTRTGDRWDTLAWHYYQDANRFGELIAANPLIPIVPVLPAGVELSIPILSPTPNATRALPPWTLAAIAAGELQ